MIGRAFWARWGRTICRNALLLQSVIYHSLWFLVVVTSLFFWLKPVISPPPPTPSTHAFPFVSVIKITFRSLNDNWRTVGLITHREGYGNLPIVSHDRQKSATLLFHAISSRINRCGAFDRGADVFISKGLCSCFSTPRMWNAEHFWTLKWNKPYTLRIVNWKFMNL